MVDIGLTVACWDYDRTKALLDGRVGITRFRELQIEDLLGREPVKLEEDEVESFIRGKTVMVTGAGGSIGAEMVRQVAKYRPERLLLVERAEFVLFETDRELRFKWPEIEIHPLVADVCDSSRMRQIFARFRPQVVFHAAAHKHVPLVELNVTEGVRNNPRVSQGETRKVPRKGDPSPQPEGGEKGISE